MSPIPIAVATFLTSVVSVSGDIDRIDQRTKSPDLTLRRTSTGFGKRIYIVDCGITATQDTTGRVTRIYTAPGLGATITEHGTLMSSIAAGLSRGLAPDASIYDIKICDGGGGLVDINKFKPALDFLATQAPGIVNLSLEWRLSAGNPDVAEVQNKIQTLRNLGFVILAAAGNSGVPISDGSFVTVPAVVPEAITISSMQYSPDRRLSNSDSGPEVDYFGPATLQAVNSLGVTLTTTDTSGTTALASGLVAAASQYGQGTSGAGLEAMVQAGAIWDTIQDALSPNAAQLFSDLGTVGAGAWPAYYPGISMFCGVIQQSITTVTAITSGPGDVTFVAGDIRCPGANVPVAFGVEKRSSSGSVVWRWTSVDPVRTNSAAGEAVADIAVNSDGSRVAIAVTSRESRFGTLTNSIGQSGGLDAYLVELNGATGGQLTAYRGSTPADDFARAVVYGTLYGNQVAFMGIVAAGNFPGAPALQGLNDVAIMSAGPIAGFGFAVFARPGEVRINDVVVHEGAPVFAGAANVDVQGNPQFAFQAYAFQVLNGSGIGASYWNPQSGGDSEFFGVTAKAGSSSIFLASTSRIIPQPVGWNFVRLTRYASGIQQWQSTWTIASQWKPAIAVTPEEDVYVRSANSVLKASHDQVHFSEALSAPAMLMTLKGTQLVSSESGVPVVRIAR